jgi:hypothetical protein
MSLAGIESVKKFILNPHQRSACKNYIENDCSSIGVNMTEFGPVLFSDTTSTRGTEYEKGDYNVEILVYMYLMFMKCRKYLMTEKIQITSEKQQIVAFIQMVTCMIISHKYHSEIPYSLDAIIHCILPENFEEIIINYVNEHSTVKYESHQYFEVVNKLELEIWCNILKFDLNFSAAELHAFADSISEKSRMFKNILISYPIEQNPIRRIALDPIIN